MKASPECREYRSPAWLPGRHVQTLYPYFFLRPRPPSYRRERIGTPDGDFIDFDWLEPPASPPSAPVVALFHGLEGSSHSHYAASILQAARSRGWRGVVPHWRGCSGEPNRLLRAYHSGDYPELDWMLGAIRGRIGSAPLYAIGVSLGGSVLLNWLGRGGARSSAGLRGAASVSAPIDLVASGYALDRGLNRMYARNFLRTLVPKALAKGRRFPGRIDAAALRRVRTLREFDDVVTAPLHGFRDSLDYWTRSSSKPHLAKIELPTLVLNARNDPFVPGHTLPEPGEVNDAVLLERPAEGGHVGFASGSIPGGLGWLTQRLLDFLDRLPGGPAVPPFPG
jgi:predicted alpha/beta-fold hydrolase